MSIKEKRIQAEVEVNLNLQGLDIVEDAPVMNVRENRSGRKIDPALINKARALYIANNLTLSDISQHLNINLHTLKDYCKNQKWNIFKANPDFIEYTEELFAEVYNNLDFYDRAREICKGMVENHIYHNPRDMKTIVETFKQADERSTSLRIIAATGRSEDE